MLRGTITKAMTSDTLFMCVVCIDRKQLIHSYTRLITTTKAPTLALSPRTSWAVCLKLMSSGTVCVTMVTNSSTLPYCFTFLCRMTCQMYEYVSCRGDAIKRREDRGREPPTPVWGTRGEKKEKVFSLPTG